jgi:hypothetical protein
MSDQQPLFQNSDATERELAPDEEPARRLDAVVPYVPVRGDISQNQPVALPAETEVSAVKGGEETGNLVE